MKHIPMADTQRVEPTHKMCAATITVAIGALFFSQGCDKQRKPDKVIVPSGFSGWITVRYRVAGAPPLPIENGKNIIRIDPSGAISTSSNYEVGLAKDEYYFENSHMLTPIPEDSPGPGSHAWRVNRQNESGRVYDRFFVGTQEEYAAASKMVPK